CVNLRRAHRVGECYLCADLYFSTDLGLRIEIDFPSLRALLNDDLRRGGLEHSSRDFMRLCASGEGRATKNKTRSRNQTECCFHFHGDRLDRREAILCKRFLNQENRNLEMRVCAMRRSSEL